MIENLENFKCYMQHSSKVTGVILDEGLESKDRLICQECILELGQSKILGLNKFIDLIQENQKRKKEYIITQIGEKMDSLEQAIEILKLLKSSIVQTLSQMENNLNEWKQNLNEMLENKSYSIFKELETMINNKTNQKNQEIFDNINSINHAHAQKFQLQLQNYKNINKQQVNKSLYESLMKPITDEYQLTQSNIIKQNQKWQLLDVTQKQQKISFSQSFNYEDNLIISSSESQIKVWALKQDELELIEKLDTPSADKYQITGLQFSKQCNSFISINYKGYIWCWQQIDETKDWEPSESVKQHDGLILCHIINKNEDQFITGSRDNLIGIWKLDFKNNIIEFDYHLKKHENSVNSVSLSQNESILASCGEDKRIIIWEKNNEFKWEFKNFVDHSLNSPLLSIQFTSDDEFLLQSNGILSIFYKQNGNFMENSYRRVSLGNGDDSKQFQIQFNYKMQLIVVKYCQQIYLFKLNKNQIIQYYGQPITLGKKKCIGRLSNSGNHLFIWEDLREKYHLYKIN